MPIHGSLLLFLALTAVFLFSAIAIGVLIASITKTLQQALLLCFSDCSRSCSCRGP